MRRSTFLILTLMMVAPGATLIAQETIDFETFGYGPYDYTNPQHVRDKLPVVEKYHFNSDVESLRRSMAGGQIAGHLLYVVAAFPNHHRALLSYTKYWTQHRAQGRVPIGAAPYQTPDYLYERAINFAPEDGLLRLIYGIHLLDTDRDDEAVTQLNLASELAPDSADVNYNLGLMFLRVNDREKADNHATRAYEQGHPLPGLRKKMISAGIWSN